MSSQNQVNRDVARHLATKGSVGGKNPITTICFAVNENPARGRRKVMAAVADLEAAGSITVVRDKGVIKSVAHREPALTCRSSPETAEGKRQEKHARGVPSTLRDDQCSAVQVTYQPGYGPGGKVSSDEQTSQHTFVYDESKPYHQNLTVCLNALQNRADSEGVGTNLSVRKVLLETVDNMSDNRAARALTVLRKLNLYVTERGYKKKYTYTVDMETLEVTAEVLLAMQQSAPSSSAEHRAKSSDTRTVGVTPVVTDHEPQVSHGATRETTVSELADIIEGLEASNHTLLQAVERMDEALSASTAENNQLTEQKAALQRRIDTLESQLSTPASDPRVQAILNRHGISSRA